MGRKGVSKRKPPSRLTNQSLVKDKPGVNVSSMIRAEESQPLPVKPVDPGKAFPFIKGSGRSSTTSRNKSRKG